MNKDELIQRIGIDKTVLDLIVNNVDVNKVLDMRHKAKGNNDIHIGYKRNFDSPIGFDYLRIDDASIGILTITTKKSKLDNYSVKARLDLSISATKNNLQNLDVKEYRKRLKDVLDIYDIWYGVSLSYDSATIKQIEINATFLLEQEFYKYKDVLLMICRNMPIQYYSKDREKLKSLNWNSYNRTDKTTKLETVLMKNTSTEMKIYNKAQQLEDIGVKNIKLNFCIDEKSNIMRIEYKFSNPKVLKSNLKDTRVSQLTDKKIRDTFLNFFDRDIKKPYENYQQTKLTDLMVEVSKHIKMNKKFKPMLFLNVYYASLADEGKMYLFDIEDIKQVFKILDNGYRHYNRQVKYLDKAVQAIENERGTVINIHGNNDRYKEVIEKVTRLEYENLVILSHCATENIQDVPQSGAEFFSENMVVIA